MRKAYVVAVWLIGFIMVLADLGFCIDLQGELSKRQNVRQQKLLKLQSAEEAKHKAHIQSLRQQILSKKQSQNYPPCLKGTAIIKSVFPTEVFPGDPILIEGCSFQANQGMVLLTEYGTKLHIVSWSDTAIEAVLPDDNVLNGFADPKKITIKVSTVKGSFGSQSILLKPNFEVKTYDNIPITLGGVTPQCIATQANSAAMHQAAIIGNFVCKGTDTYTVNTSPLKNNWVFKEGEFKTSCFTRNWYTFEIIVEVPCPAVQPGNIQSIDAHLDTIIGSKTFPLPNITVNWNHKGCDGCVVGVYHNLNLFITGPKGTSPF